MILKMVMDVSNELPSSDFDRLVGVEAHVEKMKSMICLESDDVKIVGIWGPPGIGKTTIARALYNKVSCNFQLKYYKESLDVKYKWWIPPSLTDEISLKRRLEYEIRSGVLDHRGMKIPDLLEAEERLKHQRVLLILDGVPGNELEALEGLIQGLRFGSKVIVTNENLDSLRDNWINPNQIYKVAFPLSEEAQQIFSYSAFGQSSPPRGYLEHAVEVTKLIARFPLGLKVLGSALRGKSEQEWKTARGRLKRYSDDNDIKKAIRYASDGLSEKHKTLLKSIVKLIRYQRQSVNNVILSLAEKDWDVEKGIQTLADLALISISSEGVLTIHHLVENVLEHPHPWRISEAERVSDVQELIKIIKEESLSNEKL
ncbi:unnamed protein product [Microthlaspi erraticum]|uniref:NB-ARC domain-containing protein n=1 Tax=Microthlaspi erraticum TaxID=1685480 RepID=A0A6D2KWR9_9BRAS|nr:unnamed protein product [Microthlaspi erraticum]